MSSSAFESGDAGEHTRPEVEHASDGELLEQVLQQTLSMLDGDEEITPKQMESLIDVARRHRGSTLALEPVAVDLIRSVLDFRFDHIPISAERWQIMSRRIAETLLEDPQTHERIEALWARLTKAAQ